jgi:Zn-dependent peptidase ImmA (M78 family)/DNA-binding XRE family transcriptional regulator
VAEHSTGGHGVTDDIEPMELGRRLQDHRRARRETQSDVARRLGMSRPAVAAIEAGHRRLGPDLLVRLADGYEMPVSALVRQGPPPARLAAQFRLPGESSPDRDELASAVARLEGLVERYVALEVLLASPLRTLPPPPYRYALDRVEADAEAVADAERRRMGLGDGPIVNVRDTLEREAGLRIFALDLPGRVAGLFGVSPVAGPCVAINVAHPATRQRWTLAHECAHFLTSKDRPEVTRLGAFQRQPDNERFAERFAGAWLMPRAGLEPRLREIVQAQAGMKVADLLVLAAEFGVSAQALILRLEDLRFVPAGEWDRLSATHVDLMAAHRLLALPEIGRDVRRFSQRYVLLAIAAYQQALITEHELAEYLEMDRLALRELLAALSRSAVESADGMSEIELDLALPVPVDV